jgi:hypothetical protein
MRDEHEKQIEALIEARKYIKHTPDQELLLELYTENKRLREALKPFADAYAMAVPRGEHAGTFIEKMARLEDYRMAFQVLKGTTE